MGSCDTGGARRAHAWHRDRASWLAHIYDATDWYWDSVLHGLSYGRAYRRLFERLGIRGWSGGMLPRVLDCGIGAGVLSEALLRVLGGPARLHGIDLSPRLLRRAAARLAAGGSRPHLVRADARAVPIRDLSMDVVLCGLVLDHVVEPSTVLRELARVARPGALVVVVTTRPFAPDLPIRLAFRYWRHRPESVERAMTALGLGEVRRHPLTGLARPFGIAFTARAKTK
jgi:ubiquinone/menaquinone biosynthesis C-methylase UbiE